MDKNAIKKFAVWARRELAERVRDRMYRFGITEKSVADKTIDYNADNVNGVVLSGVERRQRKALVDRIYNCGNNGYEQVIDEVAYTWFNRFCALRFMEVNGYLPTHVRVFSDECNNFKPQILDGALNIDLDTVNRDTVYELKSANKTEELFKYLVIAQCNALSNVLPRMFQRIADYTELLFPDGLLRTGSVVEQLVTAIPQEDFDVSSTSGQIEIIGWLYQYYISERHEEVVDPLHGKTVQKEDIPAATQLFTTDWVVRYLVDNSVGRYWLERNPDSTLGTTLQYFVKPQKGELKYVDEHIEPQDVTVFDPCMGSGHFLIYAFDVLVRIYEERGYSARDAAQLIVQNNIFGLDIDNRATQLAYFSVMMKARQYDRRFLERNIQPNVYAIDESDHLSTPMLDFVVDNKANLRMEVNKIVATFRNGKEYGSILQMPPTNIAALYKRIEEIKAEDSLFEREVIDEFLPLVQVADVLSRKYAVAATNPPYLNKYDAKLKSFIESNYKAYGGDLFSVFIYRNLLFCKTNGFSAYMTPNVWMFIKTYERLREYILENKQITTLVQMAKGAFFKEATVDICGFVLCNEKCEEDGLYIRLEDFKGDMEVQKQKVLEALKNDNCNYFYESSENNFSKIPGSPIAYWVSISLFKIFEINRLLGNVCLPRQGLITGDNDRFLRLWFEVSSRNSWYGDGKVKWQPINKGGEAKKWYGNRDYIVNWENNGYEIQNFRDKNGKLRSRPQNLNYNFKKSVSWSLVTSGGFTARYYSDIFMFNVAGIACFPNEVQMDYILALLNSKIVSEITQIINPTINMNAGDIAKIPVVYNNSENDLVDEKTNVCIGLSKSDWDSYETSWDFKRHPLV